MELPEINSSPVTLGKSPNWFLNPRPSNTNYGVTVTLLAFFVIVDVCHFHLWVKACIKLTTVQIKTSFCLSEFGPF